MTDAEDRAETRPAPRPYYPAQPPGQAGRPQPASLADVLERVLDKGIVIAGDKIRLLVASVDKAAEMGIDWWRNDPMLNGTERSLADENKELRQRIEALEGRQDGEGEAGEQDELETPEEDRRG